MAQIAGLDETKIRRGRVELDASLADNPCDPLTPHGHLTLNGKLYPPESAWAAPFPRPEAWTISLDEIECTVI